LLFLFGSSLPGSNTWTRETRSDKPGVQEIASCTVFLGCNNTVQDAQSTTLEDDTSRVQARNKRFGLVSKIRRSTTL
jgi:hypothetical protein